MIRDIENEVPLNVDDKISEKGSEWPQILAILVACLASLTTGIFLSWPSPYLLKISRDKENYDINEDQASYLPLINPIAAVISCPFISQLCDIIGRKNTLLLSAFPHTLSWILSAFTHSVYVFYVARILAGIAESIIYLALPMYIGEIATPRVRGIFGNTISSSFFLGELLITILGSYVSVKQSSYICLPIPILFFISFWFMPESPYFYLMKHRYEDAKTSLMKLTWKTNVEDDFKSLKVIVRRQMSESGTWMDLFTIVSNRKALVAGIFLRVSQILGGFVAFLNSTQYIFEKSGGTSVSPEISSMIYVALIFILNICGSLVVDKLGRRLSYMASLGSSAVVLFLESLFFYLDTERPDIDVSNYNWFPLVGLILYSIFSSFGIANIPTLMLGELFSTSIKSKGLTVLLEVLAAMTFLGNYILYTLNSKFGLFAPFLFFSCFNLVSFFLSYFLVPETKGKTLEEIQQSMKGKKREIMKESLDLVG